MLRVYVIIIFSIIAFIQCSPKMKTGSTAKSTSTRNSSKVTNQLERAKRLSYQKEYQKAISLYDDILSSNLANKDALLGKSGVLYILEEWQSSKDELNKVLALDPEYNKEIYFSLGMINENLKLHEEAVIDFDKYIARQKTPSKKKEKAFEYRENNKFIAHSLKNPKQYDPILLQDGINTDESEYWAVMSADNHSFVFTRRINHQEDLFISELKSDSSYIKPLTLPWNTNRNEAAHCISPDGNLILFTRCDARDSKGGCDLYYTQFKRGIWTEPKNMGSPINSKSWDAQPSLSSDGNTLYFSSKRTGTHGQSDIFISHLKNRKWSEPKPLSSTINTTKSDESPYLHPDGQTLYFRSNGRVGMGSFDIYYSKKDPYTQEWTTPINMGYPINTYGEDGALTVAYDGKTAYYATDEFSKKQGRIPNLDIVQFELPKDAQSTPVSYAQLHIIDKTTQKTIRTAVKFYDITDNKLLINAISDSNGDLLVSLVSGKEYLVNINNEKYNFFSENLNLTDNLVAHEPFLFTIELMPITPLKPTQPKEVVLHNIFFKTGSATLLPGSMQEISNLYDYMVNLPNKKIEIVGHTDNVGSSSDNKILSENRAKAVYHSLLEKGIDKNRISFIGLGETSPIADNNTEEGRRKNRRTSFFIK